MQTYWYEWLTQNLRVNRYEVFQEGVGPKPLRDHVSRNGVSRATDAAKVRYQEYGRSRPIIEKGIHASDRRSGTLCIE